MAKKKASTLLHARDLRPEDVLIFVELHGFSDDLKRLDLNDDDLHALQVLIMVDPHRAPVIAGTGGLRKLRFAPARWRTGKSGAARVCYVYLEEWKTVLLVTVYSKDEQDDIPAAQRAAYRKLIGRIQTEYATRTIK
jgi:hypothetical protein